MTSRTLSDDCFVSDRPLLRHAEALDILSRRIVPSVMTEVVPLAVAAQRILAAPAAARHPVPLATNSAVDGFAFAHASYAGRADPITLEIVGRAAAGHPFAGDVTPGAAVRIFTGAVLPADTDTVVMQEDASASDRAGSAAVVIPAGLKRAANVRQAGEDVAQGEVLVAEGSVLRPQDLAALASIGFDAVPVFRKLRVAIVSTGDEVVAPGSRPIAAGEVYDANAPLLTALVALAGADATHLGVWPDQRSIVERNLADAARRYDVILTSGGASKGAEDHMAASLDALGRRHLWQLAIKPGRPMMFGQIADGERAAVVIGLPGNPVAVFVCFLMYVYPMLRRLGGAAWTEPRRFMLPALFAFTGRKQGRREFWRGMTRSTASGLAVDKFARDGSGLISGLRAADGLIDIPEDTADIRAGDMVAFIPFTEFGIVGR